MKELIQKIIDRILKIEVEDGSLISDLLAKYYCLNHFRFKIGWNEIGIVNENPLSPYGRFGLSNLEAAAFIELTGFICGAIAHENNRYLSEFEFEVFYNYLDEKLRETIENIMEFDEKGEIKENGNSNV